MADELPSSAADRRELAARIVAAYVRRNEISADQIASLIATVHQALVGLGKPQPIIATTREPAVPIRRSVGRDFVICLECGWRGQLLRRHISNGHGLTIDAYRTRWKLPREHALVALGYSERRSGLAKQAGLGRTRNEPSDASAASESTVASTPRRRGRPRSAAT
jgi:predicted transcriptional regulator